jgi:ATP-dependent DNA helicase RecG
MYNLHSPITEIPKIGPKYKVLLENLDIFTVKDLIYHFPFRYDDFSKIKAVKDVEEGESVTIEGIIGEFKNIFTRNSKRMSRATIVDFTGELPIIWFNQHYLSRVVKEGDWYKVSGKVGMFNNKLALIAPEIEKGKGKSLNTGRLVPIYATTTGVSTKWLRTRINDVLSFIGTQNEEQQQDTAEKAAKKIKKHESATKSKSTPIKTQLEIPEFLPPETVDRHELQNLPEALHQIHFPDSELKNTIARKRFAFEEFFLELLKVEERKSQWAKQLKSYKYIPKAQEIDDFVNNLPFTLTESQKQATYETLLDMQKDQPMNRLLEGDVGTGKTMVAIIAAYFAHLNNTKVLYMAPTEILAKQHFETFTKFFEGYEVEIAIKTGSRKLNTDTWDILIGTHALLFQEEYENVGLITIDEQHRFGVEQRGKLLKMLKNKEFPHCLTMTATPIPRTLALTLYGDLSMSALKEHPNRERVITTKVVTNKQREETYKWIKDRGEPAFIVCPLIEESGYIGLENVKAAEAEFKALQKGIFSDIEIDLLHGRMKSKEKDAVVERFRNGEIQVLVSTPVIEVGVDIPEATIMVIESAERYGLASLHQLRGRVGRGDKGGFCFIFMSNYSKNSYSRLKNLETVNNGLELAEIDMGIRGQGDIFGVAQHGFRKFKVAQLDDLVLLEQAKKEAQEIFPRLEGYPLLQKAIEKKTNSQLQPN